MTNYLRSQDYEERMKNYMEFKKRQRADKAAGMEKPREKQMIQQPIEPVQVVEEERPKVKRSWDIWVYVAIIIILMLLFGYFLVF